MPWSSPRDSLISFGFPIISCILPRWTSACRLYCVSPGPNYKSYYKRHSEGSRWRSVYSWGHRMDCHNAIASCVPRVMRHLLFYLSRICSKSTRHLFTSHKGINEDETIYKLFKSSHALACWYNHVTECSEHFPHLGCLARSLVHANFVLP
jgi:hypothetical protein